MRKISRRILLIALMMTAMSVLCGCGSKTVKHRNSDGTVSRIEYEKVGALVRAPHFENNDGVINMRFNGTSWYNARFANGSDVDKTLNDDEWIMVASSSNIKAYQQLEQDIYASRGNLIMVLDLEGSDDAYIIFRSASDIVRDRRDYGMDIDNLIRYYVDKTETIPDLAGLEILAGVKERFMEYDEEQ